MCTRRCFLLFVCSLQLITAIERQVFDFLGLLWVPILVNFLHMMFILFGLFGAYLYKGKYLVTYSVWSILWLGWNSFLICFYLNVGFLDRDRNSDILNFGTGSVSWFESNGPGCKPIYPTNATLEDPFRPIRPERVDGCLLDYPIIELIQSSVQIFLALLGLIGAICIGCILWDDDDSFEFMGNDIKSPQHTSVHPMYVSYSSIPPTNGSPSSTTQINPKKEFPTINNQFGVVLTSINHHSNTNSLSSTYLRTHNFYPPQTSSSNINSPAKSHQFNQSPTAHYKLIDQRQMSSSSSLNNQYNSRHNLINKSASTQQIIKRNPSFTSSPSSTGGVGGMNVTGHRSDIRYTEIISATDEILMNDDRDVDANSIRSYGRPSSQASTAAASPIVTNKLMATNLQQQQLISKNFGIQSNPLSNLMHNEDVEKLILRGSRQQLIDFEQQQIHLQKPNLPTLPPPVPRIDYKGLSPSQGSLKGFHNSPHHQQSPQDKFSPQHQHQQFVTRSPNLNHMSKRRQSHHQQQSPYNPLPPHRPLESASINTASRTPKVGLIHREPIENIRDRPLPPIPRYNLNQFIPEYNYPNPLPAIPPHMMQHPMYRVRSQDRISNRLKRHTGVNGNNERPRSFCNNMINYQDYKDIQ